MKRSGRLEKGAEDLPSMLPSLSIRDASRPHTKTSKSAPNSPKRDVGQASTHARRGITQHTGTVGIECSVQHPSPHAELVTVTA